MVDTKPVESEENAQSYLIASATSQGNPGLRLTRRPDGVLLEEFTETDNGPTIPIKAPYMFYVAKLLEHIKHGPSRPNATTPRVYPRSLTEAQRETIVLALDQGYYTVPRGITALELAAELDVSDQSVSERLRRAHGLLVEQALTNPEEVLIEEVLNDLDAAHEDCQNDDAAAACVRLNRSRKKLLVTLGKLDQD